MARNSLDLTGVRVTVLPHALQAARARLELHGRDVDVQAEVERRIREAAAHSTYDQKPNPFRRPGAPRRPMPIGQRVVVWKDTAYVIDIGRLPVAVEVVTVLKALPPLQPLDRGKKKERGRPRQ